MATTKGHHSPEITKAQNIAERETLSDVLERCSRKVFFSKQYLEQGPEIRELNASVAALARLLAKHINEPKGSPPRFTGPSPQPQDDEGIFHFASRAVVDALVHKVDHIARVQAAPLAYQTTAEEIPETKQTLRVPPDDPRQIPRLTGIDSLPPTLRLLVGEMVESWPCDRALTDDERASIFDLMRKIRLVIDEHLGG